MTKISRLIFRLDFKKMSTGYVNAPGTAIDILDSAPEDFWDNIGESPSNRSLNAKFHSQGEIYREVNIDPHNINGIIEYPMGVDLDMLRKNNTFVEMARLVDRFIKTFEADKLVRAGIRFYVLGKAAVPEGEMKAKFANAFAPPVNEAVSGALGHVEDSSMLFVGQGDDEIHFRAQFGPHIKDDAARILFPKGGTDDDEFFIKEGFNFLCDIDLYEKDLSFKEFSLSGWSKTKVNKAIALAEAISAAITA